MSTIIVINYKQPYMNIYNKSKNYLIATHAVEADTFSKRLMGLMGRKSIGKNEALILRNCGTIHTFFMKFPIDIVFLDRNMIAVKVLRRFNTYRIAACPKAAHTIELMSGSLPDNIGPGDKIVISDE